MIPCPRPYCRGALYIDEYQPEDGLTCLSCGRRATQDGELIPVLVATEQPVRNVDVGRHHLKPFGGKP